MDPRVASLIALPSENDVTRYYDAITAAGLSPGLQVRHIGFKLGKGVFATRQFKRKEVVLKESKLVGAQHTLNKDVALVCGHCSTYVGSIELQIGRRLLSEGVDGDGDQMDASTLSNSNGVQVKKVGVFANGRQIGDSHEVGMAGGAVEQSHAEKQGKNMEEALKDVHRCKEREEENVGAEEEGCPFVVTSAPCQNDPHLGGQVSDCPPTGAELSADTMERSCVVKLKPCETTVREGEVQTLDMEVHGDSEGKEEGGRHLLSARDPCLNHPHVGGGQGRDPPLVGAEPSGARPRSVQGESCRGELLKLVQGLVEGSLALPYSEGFKLPAVVGCPGGCVEDVFCSEACANDAWDSYHSLLCTGPRSRAKSVDALLRFKQHADGTNDIFHVAGQVIASTLLRAERIENRGRKAEQSTRPPSSIADDTTLQLSNDGRENAETSDLDDMAVLKAAWEPFAMGHKTVWWEAVACPEGMDKPEEAAFRAQLQTIASDSLELLREALYREQYDPLFSIEVYSRIIGMFEQNNLAVVVASPVEDYFLYIHDLPEAEKSEAEKLTKPLLDALDQGYADFCEGTAFYRLQSCMNHSCVPNARAFKRDEDTDGSAVLLAIRDIDPGEEIRISYIDEAASLPERRAALRDYGFVCTCAKCVREERLLRSVKKKVVGTKPKRIISHSLKKK